MPTTTPQPELPGMPDWFKDLMEQFRVRSNRNDDLILSCSMPNKCTAEFVVIAPDDRGVTMLELMELACAHAVTHMQRHHKDMELLGEIFQN